MEPVVLPSTRWSLVLAGMEGETPRARAALAELCAAYWYPVYAFIRREGYAVDDALDLTQSYFATFLEKNFLASVDPERGRFRSFLLVTVKHFLAKERARSRAKKRAPSTPLLSLTSGEAETRYRREPVDSVTPEDLFERGWALTVVDRVLGRLGDQEAAAGHEARFLLLQPMLTGSGRESSYKDIASRQGMTVASVKVAMHRLRQEFGKLLREEIAGTVSDPSHVDGEIRELLELVARSGGLP
jgi:RNA polymerase sigma-70 factor (ECF subfamily)